MKRFHSKILISTLKTNFWVTYLRQLKALDIFWNIRFVDMSQYMKVLP